MKSVDGSWVVRDRYLYARGESLGGVGHWRLDASTGRIDGSPQMARLLSKLPGEPHGLERLLGAFHADDREQVKSRIRRALEGGEGFTLQLRLRPDAEGDRVAALTGFCVQSESGAVQAVLGTMEDVTDALKRQQSGEIERERLLLVADSTVAGMFEWAVGAERLSWDEKAARILGFSHHDNLAAEVWSRVDPDERRRLAEEVAELQGGQRSRLGGRYRVRSAGGEERWVFASGALFRGADGQPERWVGAVVDITQQVLESERFRSALGCIGIASLLLDAHHRIEFANARAVELLGAPDAWLQGQPLRRFLPELDELEADGEPFETTAMARSGAEIPVRLTVGRCQRGGRWVLTLSDRSEERRLEGQLAHAQRMESVGQLAGGIAHDFNNLISVLMGHYEELSEGVGHDPSMLESVQVIRKVAERGASLTRRLLAYSRQQSLRPTPNDIRRLLSESVDLLRRLLPESIALDLDLGVDPLVLLVDRHRFDDVIVNLAVNAQHAMPTGGRLKLVARRTERGELDGTPPGTYAHIEVIDSGSGMSDEVRERAFDPYYTTKGPSVGSGLGLAMVYGFIRQSGGRVWLDSRPGGGTTVGFELPLSVLAPAGIERPAANEPVPVRQAHVLVVEDEPDVRRIAGRALERAGHRVSMAGDGEEALRLIQAAERLDVLFTDFVLPGDQDGLQLTAAVRRRWPSLPVVVTTGYGEGMMPALERLGDPVPLLLEKPYSREQLLGTVAKAILQREPERMASSGLSHQEDRSG